MQLSRIAGRVVPERARPHVRRQLVRLRFRGLRSTDVVLVSYPKSGSTWLRFLLYDLLADEEAQYDRIRRTMPRVGRHRGSPGLLPGDGRFLRTHEPLLPPALPPGKVLYLVRDARDVCISYFNHRRSEGAREELPEFADRLAAGSVDGYGTWQRHVTAGLRHVAAAGPSALLLRYEALAAAPVSELASLLEFLEVPVDERALEVVVQQNERTRMRRKEGASAFLRTRRANGTGLPAERRAWRDALPAGQRRRIETVWADALLAAGYTTTEAAAGAEAGS